MEYKVVSEKLAERAAEAQRNVLIAHTMAMLKEMHAQLAEKDSEIRQLKAALDAFKNGGGGKEASNFICECPNCKEIFTIKADGSIDALIGA